MRFRFGDIDVRALHRLKVTAKSPGVLQLNGVDVALFQVIARADLVAGKLEFTPAANTSGPACESFQFRVHDGLSYSSSAYSMMVDVIPLHKAPCGSNSSVSVPEDTEYTFSAPDFHLVDAEGGRSLIQIRVLAPTCVGTLELEGALVQIGQVVPREGIDAGDLKYVPADGVGGMGCDSFLFKVHDGDVYSSAAYTMTVNVIE